MIPLRPTVREVLRLLPSTAYVTLAVFVALLEWFAYLRGANLDGADLRGADRGHYDAPIPGWHTLASGYLEKDGDK